MPSEGKKRGLDLENAEEADHEGQGGVRTPGVGT